MKLGWIGKNINIGFPFSLYPDWKILIVLSLASFGSYPQAPNQTGALNIPRH
jgi:hypothetical protein